MNPVRLAIVGLGKIACDQHLPAITVTPEVALTAIAGRNAALDGVALVADAFMLGQHTRVAPFSW